MAKIIAIVRLPKDITKNEIDLDQPLILFPGPVESSRQRVFSARGRLDSQVHIIAVFDKIDFTDAVAGSGKAEVTAVGRFLSGQYFYGTDTIRIITKGRK